MHLKAFRITFFLLVVIGGATWFPVSAGLRDNNLIEIGMGSYAYIMRYAMLWPPQVKIYQDGRVVHYEADEDKFYVSHLDAETLDSLKKRLSSEQYFWKSRFIEMEGDFINVHGGVSIHSLS